MNEKLLPIPELLRDAIAEQLKGDEQTHRAMIRQHKEKKKGVTQKDIAFWDGRVSALKQCLE